ncbi:MAG: ATP-binding protein [Thermoproteota archaeon]|nr:ATP-binding protein [Thermoproteota archaeon]
MILSIASGKGGTGKTTVAVNMALSLENVQLLDCDVEEPNVHILLHPKIHATKPVYILIPKVDEELCDYCGKCADFCEYNAIFVGSQKVLVFPELCHGCGGCSIVCPKNAIAEEKREIGLVKRGDANGVDVVYGELKISEPMAVPIIDEVKKQVKNNKITLIDAPPGTSCPVIASVYKSDYCLLVTEPTPFGLYDLKMTVEVLRKIEVPFGVIVNRAGIGDRKVYEYCKKEKITILLEIPFDRKIAELYSRGVPFVLEMPVWKERFQSLFHEIKERVNS